jgi:VanZ family protein
MNLQRQTDMMNLPALAAHYARVTPKTMRVTLPLLVMAALYWLSSLPGTPLPDDPGLYALVYWVSPSLQNALHVPAYAVLAAAWYWALGIWLRASGARALAAATVASVYGVFDEWHQSFVPGRYASLMDIALNVTGVVLGIWLAARVSRSAAGGSDKSLRSPDL